MGGTGCELIGPKSLELDCIGAARFGGVNQLQGKIQRSIVIHPCFGNDKYVRHMILSKSPGRTAHISTRFREILHNSCPRPDYAAGRNRDAFDYGCSCPNH